MSWKYQQSTGSIYDPEGNLFTVGYSGHAEGLNNPVFQNVPDVGPLPQGSYEIGKPFNSETHGPYALRLTPLEGTETFGRDGFLVHGDEIEHIGEHLASLGCLIAPRFARVAMWTRGDHTLECIP
jgi:hypothetical protein